MLYTVSRSPFQCDLSALLRLTSDEDAILFLQDGVLATLKDADVLNILLNNSASLFVLENDLAARGLVGQNSDKIPAISYNHFVDLTTKHRQHLAW
ncbi:sulfurtransferase complex subunit TusB [Yersinia nurmii]|uniref:Protein TusB n=1 Tax=Yersinia nurmii TaxID=685706 RepID=A0AAW7KA98_9GAMM|nr:sulfurtransferase complex subunit TusB [Yersinia nurmii]MDN0088955.1 sulfurtransferase complex subunit TusB [Yersinia nurmii]CNE21838.1 sulfur transfer complex subunit TusB [Yersinia nurmii]